MRVKLLLGRQCMAGTAAVTEVFKGVTVQKPCMTEVFVRAE